MKDAEPAISLPSIKCKLHDGRISGLTADFDALLSEARFTDDVGEVTSRIKGDGVEDINGTGVVVEDDVGITEKLFMLSTLLKMLLLFRSTLLIAEVFRVPESDANACSFSYWALHSL